MLRHLVLVLLLASFAAHASASLRVGNKVLTIGDSAARVLELMGPPTLRAPVSDPHGTMPHDTADGLPDKRLLPREPWQYAQDGKTVVITLVGGRAVQFDTLYP
jgi:hypothetical protein